MPKILIIPEFDFFGGTRTYFKMLLGFYAQQHYDVSIALARKQADQEIQSFIERNGFRHYIIKDRPTIFFRLWYRFPFSLFFDVLNIFRVYAMERPDLIVISNGTPGLFFGVIFFPTRFLYIMHTYPVSGGFSQFLKKLLFSLSTTKRKKILTCSNFSKKNILSFFLLKNKLNSITVIHHTADTDPPLASRLRTEGFGTQRVLTLGHVTWYKNPELWIEVAMRVLNKLSNMQIEFVWAGDGDQLQKLRLFCDESGLKNIKFIGYQKNVDTLYDSCSVYFQPSLIESQGLSVIDAMRRGIPCVVSDAGGLPESVINNVTGFVVKANDTESLTEKLVLLLTNSSLSRKMGQASYRRYYENFSYSAWSRKMQKLHEELLA